MNDNMLKKCIVFIPSFNDSEKLSMLVDSVTHFAPGATILVVDDGSDLPLSVYRKILKVRLPFNLGLGTATHVAFDFALSNGFDSLIRIDADGQHKASDIPRIANRLTRYDIAIGTRTNPASGHNLTNLVRRLAKSYIYFIARITLHKGIPKDLNSGFLAFNKKAMCLINQEELERYPEPQIILFSVSKNLRITEVEIEQLQRDSGRSTLQIWSALAMLYRVTFYCILILLKRVLP